MRSTSRTPSTPSQGTEKLFEKPPNLSLTYFVYIFIRLTDALLLLNCSPTTAAHLETLYKEWLCSLSSSSEAPSKEMEFKQALQRQLGVYSLKPQTAYQLLRKRV